MQTTALILAVQHNQKEAVDLMLKYRADPARVASSGFTPLMCAAVRGSLSIMRKLLKCGANVHANSSSACTLRVSAAKSIAPWSW